MPQLYRIISLEPNL